MTLRQIVLRCRIKQCVWQGRQKVKNVGNKLYDLNVLYGGSVPERITNSGGNPSIIYVFSMKSGIFNGKMRSNSKDYMKSWRSQLILG